MRVPGYYSHVATVIPLLLFFCSSPLYAQETNAHVAGIVKSENGTGLPGATISVVHEPTRNIYFTQTSSAGFFYFFNLKPGGPYTIHISFTGYEPLKKTNLYFSFSPQGLYSAVQDNEFFTFILKIKTGLLPEVEVSGEKNAGPQTGIETSITNTQIISLPSISRNLQDYIRLTPQASVNSDGGISLAGQNNKYNAFFIDGANNNDLLGLASSGINGGQTNSPPISIEAIEEIKVLQSPYDVQYGNFTGGSINAVTKSGSNQFKSSAWYYFRNEQMAGKSPRPLPVNGSPGVVKRQRLSSFFNQTAGIWTSGPLAKDKLFYFLLAEKQSEYLPQPYYFADYRGNSPQTIVEAFADTLRTRYGYEPGSLLASNNNLDAERINAKLDWNSSPKNKLSLSYRYNKSERTTVQTPNSATVIRFSNSFYKLLTQTHSASLEWKAYFNPKINNRLLLTYTHHTDDRDITGRLFPQIQVADGSGTITAGSNGSAQLSLFKGTDFSILNVLKYIAGKQVLSFGSDFNFSSLDDIALIAYFGSYRFSSFNSFFNNSFPARFTRTVSLVDEPVDDNTKSGAKFNSWRLGLFINDDVQVNTRLKLTMGVRLDGNVLPLSFKADSFFNKTVRPEIEKYYDLEDAQSGRLMHTHLQLSPRIGFNYKIPGKQLTVRGGAGLFTGHIINLWASEFYNVNSLLINISPGIFNLPFNPDPYHQPALQSFSSGSVTGVKNISIVTKNFKYPVVFKASTGINKQFRHGWMLSAEILFAKNIYEHIYTNVNLLPPARQTVLPGSRNVFSLNSTPEYIPIDGGNPYGNIILLSNNKGKKGFSYSSAFAINKNIGDKLIINVAYTYGRAVDLFGPNGTANTNSGQWEAIKTVNGKNYAGRSTSDFSLGHRIYTDLTKKIRYAKNKMSTFVTVFYNGQSGLPYSYVYEGSMIGDDGNDAALKTDLIYIPTPGELDQMIFLPNSAAGVIYSPAEQKQLLNNFIEGDKYLRKHRGQFAERNGARLPFTHLIDLRLQQDFIIKTKRGGIQLSIIYDVFNFTSMLNKHWGRIYTLGADNFPLITFKGFASQYPLIPQYQYTPKNNKPYALQTSTAPGSSARWISQLGIKINF